jgi:hypothetical protein
MTRVRADAGPGLQIGGQLPQKSDAHIKAAEEHDRNYNHRRQAKIPLGVVHVLVYICEAIKHGNLLKGRYETRRVM